MRFRTSGLGMEMMKTMGVSVVALAGGEVIPALERGAVESAEWAIPSHDIVMGFQNVAKNYRHGRPPIELVVTTTGRSSATLRSGGWCRTGRNRRAVFYPSVPGACDRHAREGREALGEGRVAAPADSHLPVDDHAGDPGDVSPGDRRQRLARE